MNSGTGRDCGVGLSSVVHPCAPCEAGLGGRGVAQAAVAPAGEGSAWAGSGRCMAEAWHKGGSDWERWCWCLRRLVSAKLINVLSSFHMLFCAFYIHIHVKLIKIPLNLVF